MTAGETLSCAQVAERELIERYVAGRLTDESGLADFEAHLLTCAECREEVRLGLAIRARLATPVARRSRGPWLVGAGLAAAGIAGLLLGRGGNGKIRPLGNVTDPPIYLGVAVRSAATTSDSAFDAAMDAYAARDYRAAATGLDRALASGADSAPALFFLGASRMMSNDPRAAAAAFARVLGLGESPYAPESHYYLAKIDLQAGDVQAALRELQAVGRANEPTAGRAAALADSVRSVIKR